MEPTQNEPIKAIETRYAGCRFRSRLEARWAVFFDHLGIKWEYEPQGFDLSSGYYLPDFFLPGIGEGSWFEVKPDGGSFAGGPLVAEDPRWAELAKGTERAVFVAFGLPSHDELKTERLEPSRIEICQTWVEWQPTDDGEGKRVVEVGGDCCYAFCFCHVCDKIGIQFSGANERICPHGGDARHWQAYDPRIMAAYTAARSARFEHGEVG